nr:MAG TPA: Head Tail Connector Protein [Caudoviricetes sp.]
MLKYITDEEYVELLGSESIPDNFENLVIKASNYINYNTHGRIDKNNIPEQVKYVTCLIIDLINEEETKISEIGSLKSQNIEGWSESYATPEEIKADYNNKKQSALKEYLWDEIGTDGLPLLYSGVC